MNMKRKHFFLIILLTLMFLCVTTIIYASTNVNNSACFMYSSRAGLNSEVNDTMSKAVSTLSNLGYSAQGFTDPSEALFISNALARNVQEYFCHGDTDRIIFDNVGLATYPEHRYEQYDWAQHKLLPLGSHEYQTIHYYPIDEEDIPNENRYFNWQDKKLVVLASCNSAGENSSYTEYSIADIISRNRANTVVGWYTEVSSYSLPDWLDHFHDKLAEGANVLVAGNYANGKSYASDTVKDCMTFYWDAPVTLSTSEVASLDISTNNTYDNNILSQNNINRFDITEVDNIMKNQISNFNLNDYEKKVSKGMYAKNMTTGVTEKIESYIDYSYKIGDFITNSGYTVVLDQNDKIKSINDNTQNISSSNLMEVKEENKFKVSQDEIDKYLIRAKENIDNINDIKNEEIEFYYNIEKDKKSTSITITMNDDSKLYYQYEI